MDKVELIIPANSQYLQLLRLSVSSLANRIGFNIDDIEDLKVIVTELATFIMPINEKIVLNFELYENQIDVLFKADEINFLEKIDQEGFKLKRQILMTLTDNIESTNNCIRISKKK
ncbi:MAG: hypothetical protein Q4A42_00385 [Tissierellia bacterium]|nr:hypothetical protein [Tissierellia bacterium]